MLWKSQNNQRTVSTQIRRILQYWFLVTNISSWDIIAIRKASPFSPKNLWKSFLHVLVHTQEIIHVFHSYTSTLKLRRDFKLIPWNRSVIDWRSRTQYLIRWERYLVSISLKTLVRNVVVFPTFDHRIMIQIFRFKVTNAGDYNNHFSFLSLLLMQLTAASH